MQTRLVLYSGLCLLGCRPALGQQKPNFLVIVTDDQTYSTVSSLNNKEIHTPNLDRLTRLGTTFTHAFNQGSWSGAVSVASRTMLITGQHVNHACLNDSYLVSWARTVHDNPATKVPLWGEVFRRAGYTTFMTGKWHNSDEALLKSFTEARAVGFGFYESQTPDGKKNQYNRQSRSRDWDPSDPYYGGHWKPMVKDMVLEDGHRTLTRCRIANRHTSELYGDEAIRFLQRQTGEKPFLMYVAFNAPHDPRQSPRRFVEKYPMEKLSLPENYLPEHPFDIGIRNERDERLAPYPRTGDAVRLHLQEYYAIISHADEVTGRILDELERSGLDRNTYVVFTSDHGLAIGSHGLMGKQNLYEHSMRVPLILKGPGIEAGRKTDALVYMQSLYATTCELAGLPVPRTVDYGSLVPLLEHPSSQGEEYIWGYFKDLQRMVRSTRYKLILYPQAGKVQLFDLKNDPHETDNLAGKARYHGILTRMFDVMKVKQEEFEDHLDLGSLFDYRP